jgi:hypothetical protein
MTFTLTEFEPLLAEFDGHSGDHSKCLTELAMALHYLRRDYPAHLLDQAAAARLEDVIHTRIHEEGWLRMVANDFVLHQCATPYVFLRLGPRAAELHSPVHEGLLDDLAAADRVMGEQTPYRALERPWLLALTGRGALPDWRGTAVMRDAGRAYGFDRAMAYAFTHTVFYASDFGARPMPDEEVRGVALMLAAMAMARNDVDLFWECCMCAVWQPLTAAEWAGLLHCIAEVRDRNPVLFQERLTGTALRQAYHPMLVHDLLRGAVLARHGVDILTHPQGAGPGEVGRLGTLAAALARRDAEAIRQSYAACEGGPWLKRMVAGRLETLQALAERNVLFAREYAALGVGMSDADLHRCYARQIGEVRASLA